MRYTVLTSLLILPLTHTHTLIPIPPLNYTFGSYHCHHPHAPNSVPHYDRDEWHEVDEINRELGTELKSLEGKWRVGGDGGGECMVRSVRGFQIMDRIVSAGGE